VIGKQEAVKDFQWQYSDHGLMGVKWLAERHYFVVTFVGEPYHYFPKLLLFQLSQHCYHLMYYD
jgi:hypothetical protein